MKSVVCFGEIMARLAPQDHLRLSQVLPGVLEATFAGAEANAGVTIAQLGGRASFMSALPANILGEACLATLRGANVGTQHVVQANTGRLGLYFVETGANQRGGQVLYDRDGSAFTLSGPEAYDWEDGLRDASWLHTSGIAASVSCTAAAATLHGLQTAKAKGLTTSCDLNFRRKLWQWETGTDSVALARRTHDAMLPFVDVLIGNPFDLASLLDSPPPAQELDPTTCTPEHIEALSTQLIAKWPHLQHIAVTLRRNHAAHHNGFGAMLFSAQRKECHFAPKNDSGGYEPYEIHSIVDRVGTGDSFSGALIFALQTPELASPDTALRFAVAAACLAHSVKGDFFYCRRSEVEALMHGDTAGHVSR